MPRAEVKQRGGSDLLGSVLLVCLSMSACAVGAETAPASAQLAPLIPPGEVKRLPPVGNAQPPTDWVSKPQFQDFLLDQSIQSPVGTKPLAEDLRIKPGAEDNSPAKLWDGSFAVGLDGAEGNTEAMNLHVGFNAQRKTELHLWYLDLDYNRRTTNTLITANQLFSQVRYERLIRETPWSLFVGGTGEYDEFQDFDFRITVHGGVGYWWFKTRQAWLKSRLGSGVSHEIGGPKNDYYVPEMVVGVDYERRVSDRQRLVLTADYMPDESDFTQFRLNSLAGWEFMLDQRSHLGLRVAVRNRYNSSPGTAKPNDLDYAALLLWKF
jgi:putative salt-induced outer membrane protein YdiY